MYESSNGYNCISVMLEDGECYTLREHRLNALLKHSLKEVVNNHVHHKNGIKIDNRLENLELLLASKHLSHHKKGVNHLGENNPNFNPCIKIRKKKNKNYKQGFQWVARPCIHKKVCYISSTNLNKCKEKVEDFINSKENTYGYTSYEIIK